MTELEFLIWLRDKSGLFLHSTEGKGVKAPSNSELRRWIKDKCVIYNGEPLDDPRGVLVNGPFSLVLFPKGKRRTTIL